MSSMLFATGIGRRLNFISHHILRSHTTRFGRWIHIFTRALRHTRRGAQRKSSSKVQPRTFRVSRPSSIEDFEFDPTVQIGFLESTQHSQRLRFVPPQVSPGRRGLQAGLGKGGPPQVRCFMPILAYWPLVPASHGITVDQLTGSRL